MPRKDEVSARYRNGDVPFMAWLPKPVVDAVRAKAAREDRTITAVVRRILATALKVDTAA